MEEAIVAEVLEVIDHHAVASSAGRASQGRLVFLQSPSGLPLTQPPGGGSAGGNICGG